MMNWGEYEIWFDCRHNMNWIASTHIGSFAYFTSKITTYKSSIPKKQLARNPSVELAIRVPRWNFQSRKFTPSNYSHSTVLDSYTLNQYHYQFEGLPKVATPQSQNFFLFPHRGSFWLGKVDAHLCSGRLSCSGCCFHLRCRSNRLVSFHLGFFGSSVVGGLIPISIHIISNINWAQTSPHFNPIYQTPFEDRIIWLGNFKRALKPNPMSRGSRRRIIKSLTTSISRSREP